MYFELWQTATETKFYKFSGCLPVISMGQSPYSDIKIIKDVPIRRPYWFCYEIDSYAPFFWSALLSNRMFKEKYNLNLTTAIDISDRLGFDVDPIHIPALWVLSVEYIAN